MKKKIIIILLPLLLSGCSVEYNLSFSGDSITENVKIGAFDSNDISGFNYLEPAAISVDNIHELYDMDYENDYLNLEYKYSIADFRISRSFTECYELHNLSEDDKYYYLITSGEFKCLIYSKYKADEVKINFKTSYEIESSNADYQVGDTLTWVINENNYRDKEINIKLKKETKEILEEPTPNKDKSPNATVTYFAIVLIFAIIAYIIYKIIKKQSDKNNKLPT